LKSILFQTKVIFLGFNIYQGMVKPIDQAIQFADKLLNVIIDKTQLQRFLGSSNYVADFYQNLRKHFKPLYDCLRSNPPPWTKVHTSIAKEVKKYVKTLPYLDIPDVKAFKIFWGNYIFSV